MKKIHFWIGCALGILLLIWVMVLLRDAKADMGIIGKISKIPNFDKLAHFFVIGSLGFCGVSAASCRYPIASWKLSAKVIVIITTLSGLEELSQTFSPSRTVSFADFAASASGILFFGWLAHRRSQLTLTPRPSHQPSESP